MGGVMRFSRTQKCSKKSIKQGGFLLAEHEVHNSSKASICKLLLHVLSLAN